MTFSLTKTPLPSQVKERSSCHVLIMFSSVYRKFVLDCLQASHLSDQQPAGDQVSFLRANWSDFLIYQEDKSLAKPIFPHLLYSMVPFNYLIEGLSSFPLTQQLIPLKAE